MTVSSFSEYVDKKILFKKRNVMTTYPRIVSKNKIYSQQYEWVALDEAGANNIPRVCKKATVEIAGYFPDQRQKEITWYISFPLSHFAAQ